MTNTLRALTILSCLLVASCDKASEMTDAVGQAPSIAKLMSGFGEISKTLEGLTSKEQAEAGLSKIQGMLPGLKEAAAKIDVSKLQGEAKSAFDSLLTKLPDIEAIVAKLPEPVKNVLSGKLGGVTDLIAQLRG